MERSRVFAGSVDKKLPVALSNVERDDYARQLASEVAKLEEMDEQKRTWASTFNKERKKQADQVLEITDKVNSGKEDRLVRCEVLHDYARRVVEVIREDTREIVETRAMNKAEYEAGVQGRLGEDR